MNSFKVQKKFSKSEKSWKKWKTLNKARFARNVECDFLGDFQTLCLLFSQCADLPWRKLSRGKQVSFKYLKYHWKCAITSQRSDHFLIFVKKKIEFSKKKILLRNVFIWNQLERKCEKSEDLLKWKLYFAFSL